MLFYLVFLNVHIYIFNTTIVMIDDKKIEGAARRYSKVTDCDKEEALLIRVSSSMFSFLIMF